MQNDLRYSQACIDQRTKLKLPALTENSRKEDCDIMRICYKEGCPIFTKEPQKPDLRYSQACIDHRTKLSAPALTEDIRKMECGRLRFCYTEGCPIFVEPKADKTTKNNPFGINLKVFEEIGDDKQKKKKFYTEKAVQEFIRIQERVLQKLAWHPEIYEALDNLSSQDILDRLLGKTGLEGVATHVGGDMTLKASPKTKKLFENLEKEFAEEDEKRGKGAPPNYEAHDEREDSHGYFEKGIWIDPKKAGEPPAGKRKVEKKIKKGGE